MPEFQELDSPRHLGPFQNLGRALRWLRLESERKQKEVARAAGVTPAMLSSYEQGRKVPSLPSLAKVLVGLDADLHQLADALDQVQGRPLRRGAGPARPGEESPREGMPAPVRTPAAGGAGDLDLQRLLGAEVPLSGEEEGALRQMVESFLRWLRVLREGAGRL